MFPAHLVNCLLNILVCGLRLLGVNHMNIMVFQHGTQTPLDLVGVKDQNQSPPKISLVITADIHELVPGTVNVHLSQAAQFLPGKNDIVAVHQKIFLSFPAWAGSSVFSGACRAIFPLPFLSRIIFIPPALPVVSVRLIILLSFPISAQKNLLNLLLGDIIRSALPRVFPPPGGPGQRGRTSSRGCSAPVHGPFPMESLPPAVSLQRRPLLCTGAPAAIQMGILPHLVPLHHKSRPVGTEHRGGRILQIGLRFIGILLYYLVRIMAGLIPLQGRAEPPLPPGVGRHLSLVSPHGCRRGTSRENRPFPLCHRRVKPSMEPLHVGHGSAQKPRGNLQRKRKHGLKQQIFPLHQALPESPTGRLPEVPALSVL